MNLHDEITEWLNQASPTCKCGRTGLHGVCGECGVHVDFTKTQAEHDKGMSWGYGRYRLGQFPGCDCGAKSKQPNPYSSGRSCFSNVEEVGKFSQWEVKFLNDMLVTLRIDAKRRSPRGLSVNQTAIVERCRTKLNAPKVERTTNDSDAIDCCPETREDIQGNLQCDRLDACDGFSEKRRRRLA